MYWATSYMYWVCILGCTSYILGDTTYILGDTTYILGNTIYMYWGTFFKNICIGQQYVLGACTQYIWGCCPIHIYVLGIYIGSERGHVMYCLFLAVPRLPCSAAPAIYLTRHCRVPSHPRQVLVGVRAPPPGSPSGPSCKSECP